MIGSLVSHFRILDLLGKGGMGEVYRAEDTTLGRTVAIKFLAPELVDSPLFCDRFLREARSIAAINHPHICSIFETGEHDGRPFFVMEYLEGQTLTDVVAEGPLDQAALDSVAMQLADALAAAHGAGVLHRDLKPANIIRDARGNIKLLDFGLAKDLSPGDPSPGANVAGNDDATIPAAQPMLTQTGTTLGTYAYMSPEQLRGEELDQRSDLFALGLILYELATGERAIKGNTMAMLIDGILNRPVPPPVSIRADLSPQMNAVVQRLTATKRDERFESATDVRQALMLAEVAPAQATDQSGEQAFLSTLGAKRSPGGLILGILGLFVLGLWFALHEEAAWLSLMGVLLLVWGGLTWRREGRKIRRQRKENKLRITRLEDESPGRAWLYAAIFSWVMAIFYTWLSLLTILDMAGGEDPEAGPGPLFFSIPFAALMWLSVIKGKQWRDNPPARNFQELEIQASYAQILSRISQIIAELEAQVTGMNLEEGLVRATTSSNVKTWGSRLSFHVTEKDPGLFVVKVVSEPVVAFEILEFGANKANVRRAVEILVQD